MAKEGDHVVNEGSTLTSKKENSARKSWAEEHGGLIFLIIVVAPGKAGQRNMAA